MEQCQVMKPNSMQCQNTAFVLFNKVPYCLLHLNAKLNDQITIKTLVTREQFELVNKTDENENLLEKAMNFTNDAVNTANSPQG